MEYFLVFLLIVISCAMGVELGISLMTVSLFPLACAVMIGLMLVEVVVLISKNDLWPRSKDTGSGFGKTGK